MGLFKKKQEPAGEKKDLKQNYTTEDHKTDLGELLSSFGTDANKVSTHHVVPFRASPSAIPCTLTRLLRLLPLMIA